jgi:hypothetical protein
MPSAVIIEAIGQTQKNVVGYCLLPMALPIIALIVDSKQDGVRVNSLVPTPNHCSNGAVWEILISVDWV